MGKPKGAAHAQGLVHRDIKPANILVEPEVSRVLVTDFGLARAVDDASATHSGYFVGTPNYMSPEQVTGKRVDGRSDLFSLGSVIYFMATGRMPFRAESPLCVLNRISHDEPTGIQQINSDISKTLANIVVKLLEKNPDDRFQSAGKVHEVLEKYLAYLHQPDVSKPPTILLRSPPPEKRAARARSWLYSVAGLGLVLAMLAFGISRGWLPVQGWSSVGPSEPTIQSGKNWAENGSNSAAAQTDDTTKRSQPDDVSDNKGWAPATLGGSGDSRETDSEPLWDKEEELVSDVGVPGRFVTVEKPDFGKNVDGYTLYLPESYSSDDEPFPMIFYLQGVSGVGGEVSRVNKLGMPKLVFDLRGEDNELSQLLRDRFIIVSPHITRGDYFEDVKAMQQIIKEVAAKHQADTSRVYLTGLSRGGTGVWGIGSRLEGVFAAAAPMAGNVHGVEDKGKLAKMPMWVAHNVGDNFKPVAVVVTKLNKLSKTPFQTIDATTDLSSSDLKLNKIFMTDETDDHDAWSRVYNDAKFYRWLLQQRIW